MKGVGRTIGEMWAAGGIRVFYRGLTVSLPFPCPAPSALLRMDKEGLVERKRVLRGRDYDDWKHIGADGSRGVIAWMGAM